jgi:hypothetical protein
MPRLLLVATVSAVLSAAACEKSEPATRAVVAADFDLPAAAALVREGRVKDAADLQRKINRSRPRVDVDHDGRPDTLHVVERRDGNHRRLEIRAVPSSMPNASVEVATPVAYLDFTPTNNQVEVVARYAEVVASPPPPFTFVVTPVPNTLAYWLVVVDHPVFVAPVVFEVGHAHFKHHKHHKW